MADKQNTDTTKIAKPEKTYKDIVQLGTTALLSLYALFMTLNLSFEWFTPESINAFGVFALAVLSFGAAIWTGWRNTYTTAKGLERAATIIDKNTTTK